MKILLPFLLQLILLLFISPLKAQSEKEEIRVLTVKAGKKLNKEEVIQRERFNANGQRVLSWKKYDQGVVKKEYEYDLYGRLLSRKLDSVGVYKEFLYTYEGSKARIALKTNLPTIDTLQSLYIRSDGKIDEWVEMNQRRVFTYNQFDSLAGITYYLKNQDAWSLEKKELFIYDGSKIIEKRTVLPDQTIVLYSKYEYDENDLLVRFQKVVKGVLVEQIEYVYSKEGVCLQKIQEEFGNDPSKTTTVYSYYSNGSVRTINSIFERNKTLNSLSETYEYSQGELVLIKKKDENGQLNIKVKNGKEVAWSQYDSKSTLIQNIIIQYK